jgi:hypothetical protein
MCDKPVSEQWELHVRTHKFSMDKYMNLRCTVEERNEIIVSIQMVRGRKLWVRARMDDGA